METDRRKNVPVVYSLYGLYHPVTNELRYIGQTSSKPRNRLLGHIQSAKTKTDDRRPVTDWIRKLMKSNLLPVQKVLYSTYCESEIDRMEVSTIRSCKDRGFRLLNVHRGGASCRGHKTPEEVKQRISKTLKDQFKTKQSHLKGKKLNPDHKKKVVEALARGNQNWTEERKQKATQNLKKWMDDPVLMKELTRRRVESRLRNKLKKQEKSHENLH